MWPCNNVTIHFFYVTYIKVTTVIDLSCFINIHQLWNIPTEPANAFQTKKNKKYTYSVKGVVIKDF